MVTKLPGVKKTLLRLILQSRNFRNTRPFEAIRVDLYIHGIVTFTWTSFVNFHPAQVLRAGPAQDVTTLRIHRDKIFVSGEAWRLFQEAHPEQDFSVFGSRFRLDSLLDASIFILSSFFAKRRVRVLRVQVLRRFRRQSPLARLPASSTLLMLATLQKTIVVNPDMLSNSCSRFCNYQCNWCRTISKFLCK
jgi:hypothetical protein